MKDGRSLLLLLLSIGFLSTWFYHLYDKSQYSNRVREVVVKDTSGIAGVIRDSLQKLYASRVDEMGDTIDSIATLPDSILLHPDTGLREILRLRNEIITLLEDSNIDKKALKTAENKIRDLQTRIDDVLIENSPTEDTRKKLNGELNEITRDLKKIQQNRTAPDSQRGN